MKFVEALEEKGVWSRDADELRAKLEQAGVDTERDKTWAQLVDHAYSHFVEPELIQPTFVYDWPIEMSPFARTTDDDPTLVERFEAVVARDGVRERVQRAERQPRSRRERFEMQAAERAAGDGGRGGRSGLRRGALLRDAADGRVRHRDGPAGDGADGRDTIRDVILFPALRERN